MPYRIDLRVIDVDNAKVKFSRAFEAVQMRQLRGKFRQNISAIHNSSEHLPTGVLVSTKLQLCPILTTLSFDCAGVE